MSKFKSCELMSISVVHQKYHQTPSFQRSVTYTFGQ